MDYELEYHPQAFGVGCVFTQGEHESGEPASAYVLQLTFLLWTLSIFFGVD